MSDPRRWRDDPRVSAELRQALSRSAGPRELDRATRTRVGARLGRLSAVPLTAATWFSVKSAAALGIAGGVAAAGTLAVAEHYHFSHGSRALAPSGVQAPGSSPKSAARADATPPRTLPSASPAVVTEPSVPDEAAAAPVPALNPSTDLPRSARAPAASTPSPSASARLAEETQLLERARRALSSSPGAALALVSEHAERFPGGQLAAERRLLEVEALYRVGRKTEARALGTRLLATGASGLYAERVERLLEKIDNGSSVP